MPYGTSVGGDQNKVATSVHWCVTYEDARFELKRLRSHIRRPHHDERIIQDRSREQRPHHVGDHRAPDDVAVLDSERVDGPHRFLHPADYETATVAQLPAVSPPPLTSNPCTRGLMVVPDLGW